MKKLFIFMVACCFILTGCGSESESKGKGDLSTLSKNTELTSQLSKEKDVPEFILMGAHFILPCKLQDFYDQGWELIDQIEDNPFDKNTFMIEPESSVDIKLSKDYRMVTIKIDNISKEATSIQGESVVSSVYMENNNNVTADDFIFSGKGTIKSSLEDLATLYEDSNSNDSEKGINYKADNGLLIYIRKTIDESRVESVKIEMEDKVSRMLSSMSLLENKVIDKAKNASFELKFNCESGVQYPPKNYKNLLEDIEKEEGLHNIVISGKVTEKAAAKKSGTYSLDNGKEIYVFEDELGNKYSFYSKIGDTFEASDINIGDTIKLYCIYAELVNVEKDVNYPLFTASIVYVNDTLLVDAAS
ncbi:hypothetical protein [Amedibacillus sp. YH-ame10]